MPKNIIVCSDGTGNTAIKGRGTNVFKMFESVDLNSHRFHPERAPQVAIYDDGVGTESFKPLKLLGGAAGVGLSRNVRQLYRELCRIYDPDDRIFLFGFSRGAFTVRSLGGLISTCGIIDVTRQRGSDELGSAVEEAYQVYRGCYRTDLVKLFRGEPDRTVAERFRQQHCYGGEKIWFIGVWDTVDAVGLPLHIADVVNKAIYQFKFPDLVPSRCVQHAYHALAIDDERQSFHPLLWDQRALQPGQIVEQVWFAGAHSNVGGGYPKQGMSLVALDWLMEKAGAVGLRFVDGDRSNYRDHANVDDKLYNPRSGLGMFYRWLPRSIAQMCRKSGVQPKIHLSVLERIAHGTDDYRPGNLPPDSIVVITPTGDAAKDAAAGRRAAEAQKVLNAKHADGRSLLEIVDNHVRVGRHAYRVMLLTCIAVLLLAAWPAGASRLSVGGYLEGLGRLIFDLLTSPIDTALALFRHGETAVLLLGVLAGGLALAWLLSWYSNRGMNREFAKFWFREQQSLRSALKQAREMSRGGAASTGRGAQQYEYPQHEKDAGSDAVNDPHRQLARSDFTQ